MVHVLHAHWSPASAPTQSGAILFWAEVPPESGAQRGSSRNHPFCAGADILRVLPGWEQAQAETFTLLLPSSTRRPLPSPQLGAGPGRRTKSPTLRPWNITGLRMDPVETVVTLMEWLDEERPPADVRLSASVVYWQRATALALEALAQQRLIPGLKRFDDGLYARWLPLLDGHRVASLGEAMPPVCRAGTDLSADESPAPEALLRDFLEETCDTLARAWTSDPGPAGDPSDPGSRWVHSLFGRRQPIGGSAAQLESLQRSHRLWLRNLGLGGDEHFRVALRLSAPDPVPDHQREQDTWLLEFLLQARDDPSLLVGATDIWRGGEALAGLRRLKDPQEKLLAGLGYAARFFAPLEHTLQKSSTSEGLKLNAQEAFSFMRECAPLLEEAGFGVLIPPWWNRSSARLRLRSRVSPASSSSDGEGVAQGMVSLEKLMNYRWELSLGEQTLSQQEFETLAALKSPLVRLRGEWVRLDPEQVEKALEFFSSRGSEIQNGGRELSPQEALRLGLGGVEQVEGLEVEDATFEDWLAEWFEHLDGERKLGTLPSPADLRADLRPYQQAGYSWLAFLRGSALGACLADDMGLGKTIQTLALFSRDQGQDLLKAPVLVVCPTSVVSNWHKEAQHFTPNLRLLIHQGPDRLQGDQFAKELEQTDLVVTSYTLLRRDAEMFQSVEWHAVVLDEAQNIKNPEAKQSKLAYGLQSGFRLALTGTPVENRLAELWSIMRFLNPGYLGPRKEFRRRFARPIEREGDEAALRDLHKLTRPLILRRLKSDPKVIQDLPEKQEMKVYAHLSEEQASLYEAVVQNVMEELEESEGIQRKGLVLSMLTSLKQVCNHPAQFLHEGMSNSEASTAAGGEVRSGKLLRLFELLDEVLSVGDRCLIFTQYKEMGEMLHQLLPERFACGVQFLHGGTSARKRTEMVRRFQEDEEGPQVFILSLKAGGTGLNLTRANHVFHFDRWWNPAVENQATDRAFRIGQKRNVEVHKFVCVGTLEDRRDDRAEKSSGRERSGHRRGLDHRALRPRTERDGNAQTGGNSVSRYRSRYRDYEFYPESRPIATDKGLKARSKRGEFTKNWWAARWIGALERLMDSNRLSRGRRYARQGQVLSIEERSGGVTAKVQGSRARPYRVDVELELFSDEQWEKVVDVLAGRAHFAARLLSGEMPEDIEEAFSAAGISLFPERRGELHTECTCPDSAVICKHIAAVHYILGERFDEDPFLIFRRRGRTEEQLTRALRPRRGAQESQESSDEDTDPEPESPPVPLEEEMESFWEAKQALEKVKVSITPPVVELSVLRRLGQPGFVGENLVSVLAPVYESISHAALRMDQGEEESMETDIETPANAHLSEENQNA